MSATAPASRSSRGHAMPSAEDMHRYSHDCLYTPPASFRDLPEEQRTLILSGWGGVGFGLPVQEQREWAAHASKEGVEL